MMSRKKLQTAIMGMSKIKTRRAQRGLTLIEAMIALGVLAYGILGVALLQDAALKRSSSSRFSFSAAQVAKGQMAQIRRVPWSALPETGGAGTVWENLCETISAGGGCIDGGGGGESGYPFAAPDTLPAVPITVMNVDADGNAVLNTIVNFTVFWRVQDVPGPNPGSTSCRKDIFVRVRWAIPEGCPLVTCRHEYHLSSRIFNAMGDRNADTVGDLGLAGAIASEGC